MNGVGKIMKRISQLNIRNLMNQFKSENRTLRRRLFLYIISAIAMILALILLLLNIFGILNPKQTQILSVLNSQLITYSNQIEHDYDEVAAYAISFAEQLEYTIQNYLTESNLVFDDLKNNTDAITELQNKLYDTVYLNMQLSRSSGAFYILNTTVNNHSVTPLYNGIYLKYINICSENTVNNEFSLYRGSVTIGKNNNVTFHSGWQNEMQTDFFKNCDSIFTKDTHYVLSSPVKIPDTWENARYVYVPIHDRAESIIGVCGFEINDLYFQLTHKIEDEKLGNIVCALLDDNSGEVYGQFSSNQYLFNGSTGQSLRITRKNDYSVFNFEIGKCIGTENKIQLGNNTYIAAVMITQAQYDSFVRQGQLKMTIVISIVAIFSFLCCVFMTQKYVAPILRKIEQVTSNRKYGEQLNIREIDDLFAFLEEKDTQYEEQLKSLQNAKQLAEEEAQKAKAAFEKANLEYELAQSELQQLSSGYKKELVLEDYEYFICNLSTLTPAENRIYELYLAGNNAKQILEILGIKENTLKYHNKNIYSKLGITSRKQLLRFAALKQHQDKDHLLTDK